MNKVSENPFTLRPTVTLELPLAPNTQILHPEQVIVKIGSVCHDIGAICYALRSDKRRRPGQAQEIVLSSFLTQRPKQVVQIIEALSSEMTDAGVRQATAIAHVDNLKVFVDWADTRGLHGCLAGGNVTRQIYRSYAADVSDRYARHEIASQTAYGRQRKTCQILGVITGIEDLARGIRMIPQRSDCDGGTEPAAIHDFSHALALNQAIFDGLCDLILNFKPFPYRLELPKSLGWKDSFLWIFPTNLWRLPPQQWGAERENLERPHWLYDYEHGRLATVDELWHRFEGTPGLWRRHAQANIERAQTGLAAANGDPHHWARIMLGMIAHNALLFLFFANTGANESVAREIETDGEIAATTANQRYRTIKFRAQGKLVDLVAPTAFMPSLRRFMELRQYLLNDAFYPYLFFTFGNSNGGKPPAQIARGKMQGHYQVLRGIDPQLPLCGSRKIRATVQDHFRRNHEPSIAANVMGHSEQVAITNYNAGSPADHQDDMTLFLNKVSEMARNQRVVKQGTDLGDAKPLEEGGRCPSYGHPKSLVNDAPSKLDCKQGCFFCDHRVLVAGEEDARKVASAAFVMEQLIIGPMHEAEFRPLIFKCDEDLKKISTFDGCREMVSRVRKDVYENGNLTPYFTDKYQLFLELRIIA